MNVYRAVAPALAALFAFAGAHGQDYPNRPLRMIVVWEFIVRDLARTRKVVAATGVKLEN